MFANIPVGACANVSAGWVAFVGAGVGGVGVGVGRSGAGAGAGFWATTGFEWPLDTQVIGFQLQLLACLGVESVVLLIAYWRQL